MGSTENRELDPYDNSFCILSSTHALTTSTVISVKFSPYSMYLYIDSVDLVVFVLRVYTYFYLNPIWGFHIVGFHVVLNIWNRGSIYGCCFLWMKQKMLNGYPFSRQRQSYWTVNTFAKVHAVGRDNKTDFGSIDYLRFLKVSLARVMNIWRQIYFLRTLAIVVKP